MAGRKEKQRLVNPQTGWFGVWDALDNVVESWEKLPVGQHHSEIEVAEWLSSHMVPAINEARRALGRKASNE